ncbi:MAG TPA: FAD/NAD(P)-binding protein [Gemmataceae bacterium]|nr:FAD/NAD(P)-binding protein [Gemmataceae bacterium]
MALTPNEPRDLDSPMLPRVVKVQAFQAETHDTFTLALDPPSAPGTPYSFLPGQFNMLYGFGLGEVPISMSGDPARTGSVVHTIRAVGSVTEGLAKVRPGDSIGIRGPFGSSWPMDKALGGDVVLVSGGIGLAPLRPALYHLLRHRDQYGGVALLYGARTPGDVLYREELQAWQSRGDFQVLLTVDRADPSWCDSIGLVTALFTRAEFDPQRTVGMICGPEMMIRFTLNEFEKRGVAADRLYVSLERNMQCAVGFCGHCQFGPNFVCMDGPVFRQDQIKAFFDVREA